MKQEIISIVIACNGCGGRFVNNDGICCYTDDPDGSIIEDEAESSEWLTFTGKDGKVRHYCPDCYTLDENNVYHTTDGRAYDADTKEEITA